MSAACDSSESRYMLRCRRDTYELWKGRGEALSASIILFVYGRAAAGFFTPNGRTPTDKRLYSSAPPFFIYFFFKTIRPPLLTKGANAR